LQPKESKSSGNRVHELPENQGVPHKSGVDYESINVHGNPAPGWRSCASSARAAYRSSRAAASSCSRRRSADVIKFLDLKVQVQERLSPDELVKKLELVLPAACRYIRQIPAEWLDKPFRNRNRPIRVLCHHGFRIVEGFLESMQDGRELTYERIMQEAPALSLGRGPSRASARASSRAAGVVEKPIRTAACSRMMDTYFGKHPLHVVLEGAPPGIRRSITRQLMLILDTLKNRARPQAHGARPRGTTPARQGLG